MRLTTLCAALLLALPLCAAEAPAPAPPCTDVTGFDRLDFWVGEWDVYAGSQLVGHNVIRKILDGCAVEERWTGARGGVGRSLFYRLPDGTWKQVWVTPHATRPGGVKEKTLVEELEGGGLRFQGEVDLPDGGSYLDRTTLTPLSAGRVGQVIEVSRDEGKTWQATFDAIYLPAE